MDNTILIVEDDPELQEVLALNLQNAGYRVLRASNIRQAEALVNATLPQLMKLTVFRATSLAGRNAPEVSISDSRSPPT